jgi:hypothetical protein
VWGNRAAAQFSGWRHRDASAGSAFHGLQVWVNHSVGYVGEHEVWRIYRNAIGDWCADIVVAGKKRVEIFGHHPTFAMMCALKTGGTEIADDVLDQGAEGEDMRSHARRADDDR